MENMIIRRKTAWQFTVVENEIITNKDLSPIEKLTYITLCMFSDRDKEKAVYPSLSTLAECMGVSRKTVIRAIQALEEKSYLLIERKQNENNVYVLTTPETPIESKDQEVVVSNLHQQGSVKFTPPVVSNLHSNNSNKNKNNKTNEKNITASAGTSSKTLFTLPEKSSSLSPINTARNSGNWDCVADTEFLKYFIDRQNEIFPTQIRFVRGKETNYIVSQFRSNFIERFQIPKHRLCQVIDKLIKIYRATETHPEYRNCFSLDTFKLAWKMDKLMNAQERHEQYGSDELSDREYAEIPKVF